MILLDRTGLAAGTFDTDTNPPTGPHEQEPTPNGFNQPVQITYHKDPKECCKNIQFVQYFVQYTSLHPLGGDGLTLDNEGRSSPYYDGTIQNPDGASMSDEPGPTDFGSIASTLLFGYKIVFKTCAVCADDRRVLGCITWEFYKPPLGSPNLTTAGGKSGGGKGIPAVDP